MKFELPIMILALVIATSVAIGASSHDDDTAYETTSMQAETEAFYAPLEQDPCFEERVAGTPCTFIEMEEELIEVTVKAN